MDFRFFFDAIVEYPGEIGSSEILRSGTLYQRVDVAFLNGFINIVGPVIDAYVLERYRRWDEPFDEKKEIIIQEPAESLSWKTQSFETKNQIYDTITQYGRIAHSKLSDFEDDVLVLCKSALGNAYWFFWFDRDVADCCIGRFRTKTPKNEVKLMFELYASSYFPKKQPKQIPSYYFQGWISY